MRIDHAGVWTNDIERLRAFYCRHFGGISGSRYENSRKGFLSYFLTFETGPRLEIMQKPEIAAHPARETEGYAHLAFSVGSEEEVLSFTNRLRSHGVAIVNEPRRTGDGYFESVIADPDGNLVEITI